ncbi:MAG TPA: energy-coupling factor transporter transmembrane component T [Candidatus Dormibacteraeota bacterium]
MNPRAVTVWVGAVLVVSLAGQDPIYRALALGAAVAVLVARHRAGTRLRPALLAVAAAASLTVLLNFGLSHTGQDVAVRLPGWIPALGGPLTLEGAIYGVDIGLGLAACVIAGISLSLVVEAHQLVDALPAWLSRTGAALGAAMSLVPRLGHSFLAVREAQQMRGWRPRGLRSWSAVVVPSVLTTIEGSVLLAEAMEARAFGSGTRTALASSRWRAADLIVVLTAVVALLGFLASLALGQVASWQPYPSPGVPGVNPWPVICCLALFTPAALR